MNTTTITLRSVPPEIRDIILEEQYKIKQQRGVAMYSMESTVYAIIRDYARCREGEKPKEK